MGDGERREGGKSKGGRGRRGCKGVGGKGARGARSGMGHSTSSNDRRTSNHDENLHLADMVAATFDYMDVTIYSVLATPQDKVSVGVVVGVCVGRRGSIAPVGGGASDCASDGRAGCVVVVVVGNIGSVGMHVVG